MLVEEEGKVVVDNDLTLREDILKLFHRSALGGHSGITPTLQRISSLLYWRGIKNFVNEYTRHCKVCQHNKFDIVTSLGLLQPLPLTHAIFNDISMDIITRLLKSNKKAVIFVVVD